MSPRNALLDLMRAVGGWLVCVVVSSPPVHFVAISRNFCQITTNVVAVVVATSLQREGNGVRQLVRDHTCRERRRI